MTVYCSTIFKYANFTITFRDAITGTAKSNPIKPNNLPPARRANTIVNGFIPNLSPIILGVITLASTCWTNTSAINIYIAKAKDSESAMPMAGIPPSIGPK